MRTIISSMLSSHFKSLVNIFFGTFLLIVAFDLYNLMPTKLVTISTIFFSVLAIVVNLREIIVFSTKCINVYLKLDKKVALLFAIFTLIVNYFLIHLFYSFIITYYWYLLFDYLTIFLFLFQSFILLTSEKKMPKGNAKMIIWLVLFFCLALYLRIKNLGAFSFYHDEYWYVSTIKSYWFDGSYALWNYATSMPSQELYQWKTYINILSFFVPKEVQNLEFWLRLPSVLFSMLSVLTLAVLSKKTFNSYLISIPSVYFLTFSEINVYMARYVRHYSLFEFLTLGLLLFIVIFIDKINSFQKFIVFNSLCFLFVLFMGMKITPFAYSFIPSLILLNAFVFKKYLIDINLKKVIGLGFVGLVTTLFINNYVSIQNILSNYQLSINLGVIFEYTSWLSLGFRISDHLLVVLLILSSAVMVKIKNSKAVALLLFFWIPLIMLMLNAQQNRDFRYITNLMPLMYLILSFLIVKIVVFIQSLLKVNGILLVPVIILIALTVYIPSIPGLNLKPITQKAQADWTTKEGSRLHRRAVAPNYDEAFSFITNRIKDGDQLIVVDGINYVFDSENVDIFTMNTRFSDNLVDMKTNEITTINNVLKSGNTYLVGAYLHLYQTDELRFILNNCENLSFEFENFHYNYDIFYSSTNKYGWPSVYYCDSQSAVPYF